MHGLNVQLPIGDYLDEPAALDLLCALLKALRESDDEEVQITPRPAPRQAPKMEIIEVESPRRQRAPRVEAEEKPWRTLATDIFGLGPAKVPPTPPKPAPREELPSEPPLKVAPPAPAPAPTPAPALAGFLSPQEAKTKRKAEAAAARRLGEEAAVAAPPAPAPTPAPPQPPTEIVSDAELDRLLNVTDDDDYSEDEDEYAARDEDEALDEDEAFDDPEALNTASAASKVAEAEALFEARIEEIEAEISGETPRRVKVAPTPPPPPVPPPAPPKPEFYTYKAVNGVIVAITPDAPPFQPATIEVEVVADPGLSLADHPKLAQVIAGTTQAQAAATAAVRGVEAPPLDPKANDAALLDSPKRKRGFLSLTPGKPLLTKDAEALLRVVRMRGQITLPDLTGELAITGDRVRGVLITVAQAYAKVNEALPLESSLDEKGTRVYSWIGPSL